MTEPPLTLDIEQRQLVERTIADHCRIRRWQLYVVSCRTNHVHVVVTAPGLKPDQVRDQFKAWCTRRLKELECLRHPNAPWIQHNWWTQGGSGRYLNSQASLEGAIRYVLEGQGEATPPSVDPNSRSHESRPPR